MKKSILIPVFDEALHVPTLLRTLAATARKAKDVEILFIDNGSTDGTREMLEAAKLPHSRVLREKSRGYAEPLNLGIAEASGDLLLFLGARSRPDPHWVNEMEKAFTGADLVVGNILTAPAEKSSPYSRAAAKLFDKHSERTSRALGYALPWGPACNLGVHRELVEKTGPFAPSAGSAFDIDWCWRAMISGARITYAGKAKTEQERHADRRGLLEQFEQYGLGEAWLHRTYSFLLPPEDQEADPLLAGVDAFSRLRHHSNAAKVKALGPVLDEIATAFAGGVRIGHERPHRACPIERMVPERALSWSNGQSSTSVLVPGKGVAVLEGKQRQLFAAFRDGSSEHDLVHLFMKLFKANHHEAEHEVAQFRSSLTP